MDAYLYLTSVQAVSVLRPHNMPNGGSSYFHYQKNYLEYSLKIYEKQHDGVFLLFSEGVRGRDWGHFRTFSKTDIYFKITFSLHSFFNNRLAEMVLLPMNHHFYMQFFCCFCFFEKNLVVRRFDFEDFSLFFFFFSPMISEILSPGWWKQWADLVELGGGSMPHATEMRILHAQGHWAARDKGLLLNKTPPNCVPWNNLEMYIFALVHPGFDSFLMGKSCY